MKPRKHWSQALFRPKLTGDLTPGELVWTVSQAYPKTAAGPYRVQRIEPECPGQVHVNIVGMESSGTFGMAWGKVLVPRYR